MHANVLEVFGAIYIFIVGLLLGVLIERKRTIRVLHRINNGTWKPPVRR